MRGRVQGYCAALKPFGLRALTSKTHVRAAFYPQLFGYSVTMLRLYECFGVPGGTFMALRFCVGIPFPHFCVLGWGLEMWIRD